MIEVLSHEHGSKLRSLNISGNNAAPFEYRGANGQVIEKFSDRIQKLIKSSLTLQHLDLSSLNLESEQIKTIVAKGVRKAKSLLSFHLSGNEMNKETLIFIMDQLRIVYDEHKQIPQINLNHYSLG